MSSQVKVLVTGGNGFIGSWITKYLHHNGFEVVVATSNLRDRARLENFTGKIIVTDYANFDSLVADIKPNIIISCEWGGVAASDQFSENQDTNVERGFSIAESCIRYGVQRLIMFGSQAEISNLQKNVKENEPFAPRNSYGEAKATLFQSVSSILETTAVKFTWIRLFSVYGPLDNQERLFPSLFAAIKKSQRLRLTNCEQIWNYLHVYDVARFISFLLNSNSPPVLVNLANTMSEQLNKTIRKAARIAGSEDLLEFGAIPYPKNVVMNMEPDVSLAQSLGWNPVISETEGLQHLVDLELEQFSEKKYPVFVHDMDSLLKY